MTTRREMLATGTKVTALLAAAGLLPATAHADWNKNAFDAKNLADAAKAYGGGAAVESKDVTVTGPDIAENGAVVPVGGSTTIPNAKRLLLLVEKNPNVLAAAFDVNDAVEPTFSTRVKMGQSSDVYAVAITADNKVFFAKKEIKVTLGGCGG
jgi:sulfur-oxidizing protein SoxY